MRAWIVAAILVLLWEGSYRLGLLNPIILGSPSLMVKAAVNDWATFVEAFQVTAFEIAVAIALGWGGGILFGLIAGTLPLLGRVCTPLVSAIIAVPFVVLYPILVAWLGLGFESKIVFGLISGIFPIVLSTILGVRAIERGWRGMALAMGARPSQILFRVMMPLALPAIVSGLRLGTSLIVIGVVLAEMLASTGGLGFWISYHRSLFNTGHVYLGIVLTLAVAAAANALLSLLERRYGSWRVEQH
jgi:NitT/TauT family transport system permease protein/taurine transport system permease protein